MRSLIERSWILAGWGRIVNGELVLGLGSSVFRFQFSAGKEKGFVFRFSFSVFRFPFSAVKIEGGDGLRF